MHVHLIGVCGTGMGALAGLLHEKGHRVTGSDRTFDPPMGPALAEWGIETLQGFHPDHLATDPDLVVVGNVCRPDHVEARAAINKGLNYASFPGTLAKYVLKDRPSLVIAGTHGKTTTTAWTAFLLEKAGLNPGMLVGGIPRDFERSFRCGHPNAPFVVEGDEYDSAFFEKSPKFWQYNAHSAVLTSLEHDHIDIYPDVDAYMDAFRHFVQHIPKEGVLVAWAGDPRIREVCRSAQCRVVYFGLAGEDFGDVQPIWLASPRPMQGAWTPFDLSIGGSHVRVVRIRLSGRHNIRNGLAALAICVEAHNAPFRELLLSIGQFRGVARRQEDLGVHKGIRVVDDFAHHPTAVKLTLAGLRARYPDGQLHAIFEPRSATASRNTHQEAYPEAFEDADRTIIAPVGRPEINPSEQLDTQAIANAIEARGGRAYAAPNHRQLRSELMENLKEGDTIVLMSNGHFDDLRRWLLETLQKVSEKA